MKENILQALFATVCGAIVAYLNILLVPFAVMIAVMIIDYITGMAQAYISHTLNSRVGVTGIIKKVGYIVAVAVGVVADYLISSALVNCGIDLRINYCIGMIVTIWFIINELISILKPFGNRNPIAEIFGVNRQEIKDNSRNENRFRK